MIRSSRWLACVLLVVAGGVAAAQEDGGEPPLRFFRVHVPHGKLGEVDLGKERYVPMTAAEFTAGVARLRGGQQGPEGTFGLGALAETARYDATMSRDPRDGGTSSQPVLLGTASWTIRETGPMRSLNVGGLRVGRAWMETSAGTGDALVFGRTDGTLGIDTPQAGVYGCEWRCDSADVADGVIVFRMPLVASLSNAIHLRLPAAVRPIIAGADAVAIDVASDPAADIRWRIDVGPRRSVDIAIVPRAAADETAFPRARVWNGLLVRGREVSLRAIVEPVGVWRPAAGNDRRRLDMLVPAGVVVTDVRFRDADEGFSSKAEWRRSSAGTGIEVDLPTGVVGTRDAISVEAVAAWDWGRFAELPLVRIPVQAWAGGGVVVGLDAALALSRIEVDGCAVVPPEGASRWPAAIVRPAEQSAPDLRPALVHVEHQRARHAVRIAVEPRVAELEVGRVTVVDVSPGTVLGRVTCDVSVPRGEAFEIRGRLAKGWVLDTVEAAEEIDAAAEAIDWRVVRVGDRDEIRIALSSAVSPDRALALRLTGHRAGVPPGVDMTTNELDMVRFVGESRAAVLAVKTGPEMTVDLVGDEPSVVATDTVLAALAADSSIRVRLPVGDRFPERVMRLVRRRPPVDVRTEVRITSRDGRLTESFTFECTPQRADIDALVVHFSTVMDDRLEWSLLPPAAGALVARRIEPPDRRDTRAGEPIADSWIVELSPSARGAVTIRAACTRPFTGPTPVPLAWVEGAIRAAGVVSIREAGRFRPRVVNRRLDELPPAIGAGEQALTTVAEFSFDPARGRPDDPLPAAEIVPGGDGGVDDARAWAWREDNTVWCHASGTIEFETLFKLHNHGRAAITVSVPSPLQLQGVLIDGAVVAGQSDTTVGGEVTVELPIGQRFVDVVVRGLAKYDARGGLWWVDPHGVVLDVPVLQRTNRMLLAPDVAIARAAGGYRVVDDSTAGTSWSQRLLAATVRPAAVAAAAPAPTVTRGDAMTPSGSVVEGYRDRALVPVIGSRGGGGMLLVRTAVVESAAILAAALVFAGVLLVPAGRTWLVPCLCGAAAVGALWVAIPFDAVFRAAAWASLAAAMLRLSGLSARSVAAAAMVAATITGAARADEPLRVYVTPLAADGAGGETALVPETLFRALSRAAVGPAGVRVVSSAVVARLPDGPTATAPETWQLTIDIDADAGTSLLLDQADSGATVVGAQADVDGVPQAMQVEEQGRRARISISTAGRHRIDVVIRPALARRGDIEEAVAILPTAATGRLTLAAGEDAAAIVCEAAVPGGPFLPAPRTSADVGGQPSFDVSRAAAVRLCRAVDPRLRLASAVRAATSRNDVFWDLDACRLIATFEIDGGHDVVRSVVLAVDSDLEPLDAEVSVRAIAPHRYLVERARPVRGRWSVQVPFRMPLADPVGVFTVPSAWIENVVADDRTTLFVPAPDLSVEVKLPEGMTAASRETDGALQGFAWREDVAQPLFRSTDRPVVTIERRASRPRAAQQLAIDFEPDQVRLRLLARIDATATALVDVPVNVPANAVIDRVSLVEDRDFRAEAGERGAVDIRWSRINAGALLLVAQRPRAGRFRLEIEARLTQRPAARGSLPLMRAGLGGSLPMVVDWKSADGRGAVVRASYGEPADRDRVAPAAERAMMGSVEIVGGQTALVYDLGDVETAAPAVATPAAGPPLDGESNARDARVEWSEILWQMDGRGRAWGSARFDVVAAEPAVRLSLPPGMRLFEVLVDGRAVEAMPQEEGTWMIPLFGIRWPRTVQAVFAGESGAADIDGTPFAVPPPRIVGLPCRAVAWTIRVAPGMSARVAEPFRTVDAKAVDAARRSVAERLEDEYIRAIEEEDAAERSRMTSFARLRRGGEPLPSEEAWTTAIASGPAHSAPLHVLVPEPGAGGRDDALVLRIGRAADPTAPPRALVTLVIIAACAAAWNVASRWPSAWRRSAARLLPVAVGLAAAVWLAIFAPAWPGWLLVAVAVALVAALRQRPAADAAGESTITQFARTASVARRAEASTQTVFVSER